MSVITEAMLFPQMTAPSIAEVPTTVLDAAVLIGDIGMFNHAEDKWVFQLSNATFYLPSHQQRRVNNVKCVFVAHCKPEPRKNTAVLPSPTCFEGRPSSDPYIVCPWSETNRVEHRGYGFYLKSTCKKRKYRLECADVVMCLSGGGEDEQDFVYRVKRMYFEAVFAPST